MARPLRLEFPDALYHVTARGNAQLPIVETDRDRLFFLDTLGATAARFNVLVHAYCLMDNHYHLLLETPDPNLSQAMRHLNGVYTQAFNRRHDRVGHLFQGRYKAVLVDKETYLLHVSRYIALNPVKAGLADRPEAYRWSSYRATAGYAPPPAWLSIEWLLANFAADLPAAKQEFRQFVIAGDDAIIAEIDKGGPLLGNARLQHAAKQITGARQSVEIPKRSRYAHRPPLVELIPVHGFSSKQERNAAIAKAHCEFGYSFTAIGAAFNLHYSTVSLIVKGVRS